MKRLLRHRRGMAAALASALFVIPGVLVLVGSLRPVGPPGPIPLVGPSAMTLENYRDAAAMADLARHGINSALVAALAVPLSVMVASTAGFGMSRLGAAPRRVLLGLTVIAGAIPLVALVVARSVIYRMVGVTDSLLPLVAVGLIGGSPFNVLVFYWAFRRIPDELIDAARLEGAQALSLWRRVGMPSVRPVTVAVAVVTFATVWGSFVEPLVYLASEDLYTLPLAIRSLAELDVAHQPVMLAGAVLAAALPVVAFLLAGPGLSADDITATD